MYYTQMDEIVSIMQIGLKFDAFLVASTATSFATDSCWFLLLISD